MSGLVATWGYWTSRRLFEAGLLALALATGLLALTALAFVLRPPSAPHPRRRAAAALAAFALGFAGLVLLILSVHFGVSPFRRVGGASSASKVPTSAFLRSLGRSALTTRRQKNGCLEFVFPVQHARPQPIVVRPYTFFIPNPPRCRKLSASQRAQNQRALRAGQIATTQVRAYPIKYRLYRLAEGASTLTDGVLRLSVPASWSRSVGVGVAQHLPTAWLLAGDFRFAADAATHEGLPAVPAGRVLISIGDFPAGPVLRWRTVQRLRLPERPSRRRVSWRVRFARRALWLEVEFGSKPDPASVRLVNLVLASARRVSP